MIIVDDSPRYYYVVEAKGKDDQVKRGYVSKRSIHMIEEVDRMDSPAADQP